MIKHPTLSPTEIEDLQRWCFEQDFQELGPSIFRVLEARLLGYRRLKDSPNPALRRKAEYYARELRTSYPVYLAGRLLGPNPKIRRWIGELEREVHSELGRPTPQERLKSIAAIGAAVGTWFTLRFDLFQHPRLIRTAYRWPDQPWTRFDLWNELHRKVSIPNLSIQVDLQHAKQQVWLRLEGVLSGREAEGLGQRLRDSLARSKARLVLDLQRLQWDKIDDLQPLRERLAIYRSRIHLVLPRRSDHHPELQLLAGMFPSYQA
jgi:hypothetical protein